MKKANSSQSLALAVLTAVLGGVVGASATSAYIIPGAEPRSIRSDQGSIQRSADFELMQQDRRTERLRALQNADHAAAADEATEEEDARAYFRAQRWCIFNGYDHPRRLASCVYDMMEGGMYDPID